MPHLPEMTAPPELVVHIDRLVLDRPLGARDRAALAAAIGRELGRALDRELGAVAHPERLDLTSDDPRGTGRRRDVTALATHIATDIAAQLTGPVRAALQQALPSTTRPPRQPLPATHPERRR